MGWWSTPPGNNVSQPDGYDETQGKMSDAAWSGAGDATVVSILKKLASAGGGSAVTIADGSDVAQGTTTDLASASTVIGLLKNVKAALAAKLLVTADPITFASPQAVTGPLTDTQLRATPVPVSGTVTASGPLTDTQLRASAPAVDTELPAAAALSDAATNPTTPTAGAAGLLWDSTLNAGSGGWLRAPGTVAAGQKVQSAQLPAALVGGALSVNIGGQALAKLLATVDPITFASPQHAIIDSGALTANQGSIVGAALVASALSAANTGVTATLAAVAAAFHYITAIEIVNINPTATAIAGSAVTLSYSTTNLPGTLAWTCGNALAAGAEKVVTRITFGQPLKSSVVNTNTTIVAPAIGTGGLCRITVYYFTAA